MMTNDGALAEVGSPAWMEARRRGIGASELAAACGVSRWKSRLQLWEEKTGRAPAFAENAAMKWGTRNEQYLIADYCERNACEILGTQVTLAVDAGPPPIWATLDALIERPDGETCPLEAKCTTSRNSEIGDDDTDQLPIGWICQAQAQMHACLAERCFFAVLVDGHSEREFVVTYDAALLSRLIVKAGEFWRYVESGDVPPADWADKSEALARHRWIEDDGATMPYSPKLADLWNIYESIGKDIRRLENERDEYKAEIVVQMGDHKRAILGDGREVVLQTITKDPYTVTPKPYCQLKARKVR